MMFSSWSSTMELIPLKVCHLETHKIEYKSIVLVIAVKMKSSAFCSSCCVLEC